jgi:predicted metal-dependent phosphoesterase TrpH
MENYKGDFHMHTTASDGKLSPQEVVRRAKERGTDIIAITDHDTTIGLDEAIAEGKLQKIRVIPGIELSTIYNNESIHILGYFKDETYKNKNFQDFLYEMKNFRTIRAQKLIDNLDKFFNIKINYEQVYKEAEGVIARPHIARAIINQGYNYSWDYIFDNIINEDSPAYVSNKKVSITEGIDILKSVNAFTSLAHPVLVKNSKIEDLLNFHFDGVEAIYSQNTPEQTKSLIELAKNYGKLITAGSDFHGNDNGDTKHGDIGAVYLIDDALKHLLNQI